MKVSSPGGKGSSRRPSQVDDTQVAENWDNIFKKKDEEKQSCGKCENCTCGKKQGD